MTKPNLAIVILNWNGLKDTRECLKSVFKSKTPSFNLNVFVVDNHSTDNSVAVIAKEFPRTKLIINPKNLGFSGGNNEGIKAALAASMDWLILLNNDTTVAVDTFEMLLTGAINNKYDLASPKIYFYPGREFHIKSYKKNELGHVIWYAGGRIDWDNVWPSHIGVDEVDHGQLEESSETEFATGCCLLVKNKVFNKIGLLDTSYKAYFEDTDFCMRAQEAGFKVGFVSKAFLWHKNAGSTGGSGSLQQKRLIDDSRLRFAMRYASFRAKLALLRQKYHLP
jgi:GT2 family glycosyltransferase